VGPHRAELSIRLNGTAVKDRISRGQQKLLAASLLIAQLKLFPEGAPVQPSLLLDDPAAELDDQRLEGLIREVRPIQLPGCHDVTEIPPPRSPGRESRIEEGEPIHDVPREHFHVRADFPLREV
jgi:DNA replication and repair protein RecF